MKYAVIVYSIPLQDLGVKEEREALDEFAQDSLAELIAHEGVQRKPFILDQFHVDVLDAGLVTWEKESNA